MIYITKIAILKKLAILLLFSVTSLFAQQKKYQGLLWEVSGNGLKKSSYLYGSMHVSDKISYHLSDAFFNRLLAADIIANESEPSTWMDLMGVMGSANNYYRGSNKLYAGFYMEPVVKENLYPLFHTTNFTLNNLLFRTNEYEKEYQEETYLDMFIYRTGLKYKKKTVGLEDTKTSLINVMNIDYRSMKPREENITALQKILKNTRYDEALMNYYRDKDLDMLDSLTTLASSESYLKTLLYDRNEVMVHSIDSIAKTGSLFAAVGAAHLPGKRGIIEMLRAKGYTVKPVADRYTNDGKAKKEAIEGYFLKPYFTTYASADGMITLPVYKGAVIEANENLQSPDLANGGYINVKRLLLKDYLKKDGKPFDHKSLDSLFFENIPGKILDKSFSVKDRISYYDIKSVTKTGNAQHYRYYITPLEIIMVSMAGEKNYVRQFENEVFNNIAIKMPAGGWATQSPKKGGFTIDMPEYTVSQGQNSDEKVVKDAAFYGYDMNNSSHYFVMERTLNDAENLEETDFELKRIHYEFYTQLGIDSTNTALTASPAAFTSSSTLGGRPVQLKSVIKGAKYYLLGSVGATQQGSDRFFNSFSFVPYTGSSVYETYKDTVALYSIQMPKAQNARLEFERNVPDYIDYDEEDQNVFAEKYATRQFTLPSGQPLEVFYHKYHRHRTIVADSLWTTLKKYLTEEKDQYPEYNETLPTLADADPEEIYSYLDHYESKWDRILNANSGKITLIKEKKEDKGSYQTFEATAVSTTGTQGIKFKGVYRNGTSYLISTLVEKGYNDDDADIEKMFSTFTLLDDSKEEQLPQDRLQLFIEDAQSEHDSIRSSTLASVEQLEITNSNRANLEAFIENFDFKAEETRALTELYTKLGSLKNKEVLPFFEKQYKSPNNNTIIQFAVLEALTEYKSPAAYTKIKELLEYDLPVSDDKYEVGNLFVAFEQDTDNSALLFPDIFQYYSIPEYQQPIISFTAQLIEEGAIRPKKLKAYKKMLVTNTRLEIKRAQSRKAGKESGENEYYYNGNNSGNLCSYMKVLYPFREDKNVTPVFNAIRQLDIKETNLELARLDIKNGNIDDDAIAALLQDPEMLFDVQKILMAEKKGGLLKNTTDEQMAKSALLSLANTDTAKNSISEPEKRVVQHRGNTVTFYFFTIKNTEQGNNNNYDYMPKRSKLAAVAFINNGDRINPQAYKNAGNRMIADEDEVEEYKKTIIDATLNAEKIRATFGKRNGYNGQEEYLDEGY